MVQGLYSWGNFFFFFELAIGYYWWVSMNKILFWWIYSTPLSGARFFVVLIQKERKNQFFYFQFILVIHFVLRLKINFDKDECVWWQGWNKKKKEIRRNPFEVLFVNVISRTKCNTPNRSGCHEYRFQILCYGSVLWLYFLCN